MSMLLLIIVYILNTDLNPPIAWALESKEDELKRYVSESDFKPPIIGSSLYDPLKDKFVIDENQKSKEVNVPDEAAPYKSKDETARRNLKYEIDYIEFPN